MGVRLKAIVSMSMFFLGIFQAVSGLILFLSPKGRGAGNLLIFGLPKHTWSDYHTYVGFAIIAVAILHFSLNWRMFVNELKVLVGARRS